MASLQKEYILFARKGASYITMNCKGFSSSRSVTYCDNMDHNCSITFITTLLPLLSQVPKLNLVARFCLLHMPECVHIPIYFSESSIIPYNIMVVPYRPRQ